MTLADRICVMQKGEIQQVAPPREIYETPATSFVATFIGAPKMNLLEGDVSGGDDRVRPVRVAVATDGKKLPEQVVVGVRPDTGHYYFRDNFYADNGFIPALLILELMSRKGKTLHELLAPLREKYFISGEIDTRVSSMELVAKKLEGLAAKYRTETAINSTAYRWSTQTGTSTFAPRTRSRCSGSTSRRRRAN